MQILGLLSLTVLLAASASFAQKFFNDDPLRAEPNPRPVGAIPLRKTGLLYDFLKNSFDAAPSQIGPARNTNTLGEVPDGAWFTNRHGSSPMSIEALKRGPGDSLPPKPPFTVVGAKTDGITPGFRMRDSEGRLFFVKPDPRSNPEMATAADIMGARFFFALGYNTPQNYLLHLKSADLSISPDAKVDGLGGAKRPMLLRDLNDLLRSLLKSSDGTYRMLASLAVPGKPIGPFRYTGQRADDPNDIIPHQDRRELRGLHVLAAWLNHTDSKSINSLDTLVTIDGVQSVRHYLLDFGAAFGSDSDMPKNARFGNEFIIPKGSEALKRIVSLGLNPQPWETADYGGIKAVGRFESKVFDPVQWKGNYPNPAFLRRLPDDDYWAAKLVMSFRDEHIRAIVETGEFSSQSTVDYLTRVLIERRDKIGRAYFAKVLPLEDFHFINNTLAFSDLAAQFGFAPARQFEAEWFHFDNNTLAREAIPGHKSLDLPAALSATAPGQYIGVRLALPSQPAKSVNAYFRKTASTWQLAGIERSW